MEPTISPTPTPDEAVAIASAIAAHLSAEERDSETTPPERRDYRWHRLERHCIEQTRAATAWHVPANPWTTAGRLEHQY